MEGRREILAEQEKDKMDEMMDDFKREGEKGPEKITDLGRFQE